MVRAPSFFAISATFAEFRGSNNLLSKAKISHSAVVTYDPIISQHNL
jgi:hypothetical protein